MQHETDLGLICLMKFAAVWSEEQLLRTYRKNCYMLVKGKKLQQETEGDHLLDEL